MFQRPEYYFSSIMIADMGFNWIIDLADSFAVRSGRIIVPGTLRHEIHRDPGSYVEVCPWVQRDHSSLPGIHQHV